MGRLVITTMLIAATSLATLSAHIVRGILFPTHATAFVSSPSAAEDSPIPIRWGTEDTGQRVACFNVANTAQPLTAGSAYPRVSAIGFELPGALAGFTLIGHEGAWRIVNNVPASLLDRGDVTLDFVLLAQGPGLPPGQAGTRAGGTKFCVSGPFPDGSSIEQLINGVVIGFQATATGPIVDIGLWDNPLRVVPLYP